MVDDGPHENEKQQQLYKVLVIGDYAVGKTSIIKRYTEGYFTPNYKLTIGVDFAVKAIDWDENTSVNLQLWDVAGHERFGTMTRVYYKYAIAAIIVTKWRDDLNNKVVLANSEPIPVLLLANKCDIQGVHVDEQALERFTREQGFIGWFPTSAQENLNIDKAMMTLIKKILEVAKTNVSNKAPDAIDVQKTERPNNQIDDSCC